MTLIPTLLLLGQIGDHDEVLASPEIAFSECDCDDATWENQCSCWWDDCARWLPKSICYRGWGVCNMMTAHWPELSVCLTGPGGWLQDTVVNGRIYASQACRYVGGVTRCLPAPVYTCWFYDRDDDGDVDLEDVAGFTASRSSLETLQLMKRGLYPDLEADDG